jgi:hypothetical protein
MSEKKFELHGQGALLTVYDDKVTIETKGVLGFMTRGLSGVKTIPFKTLTSIQFAKATALANGFIQFGIMGGREMRGGVFEAVSDENSIVFKKGMNEKAEEIKEFIEKVIVNINN